MRLSVQDDFMDNSGVYAMDWITSLQNRKTTCRYGKWSPLNFSMISGLDYFRIELFDDSGIGETVIPVIEH